MGFGLHIGWAIEGAIGEHTRMLHVQRSCGYAWRPSIQIDEIGRLASWLADLLLLFIYLEVLGMAYAYYSTHSVPVTLPVLIAITGITRLILLSKDSEPSELMYEAGAVLLLAIAYGALSWASNLFKRN